MSQARSPARVLVATSAGSSPDVALPVLAALEAAGHQVRAIDVGRLGSSGGGAAWRVVRAIAGELAERRLARELGANPPEIGVAFDPGTALALTELRRHAPEPVAVVAVVGELTPGPEWSEVPADRFLAVDAEAAVALADAGVPEERVMTVGPIAEARYAAAGQIKREVLRARFKLPLSEPVILVEVEGLGYETTSQLALQLSLVGAAGVYLFAAGDDVEAATALRNAVPTLEIKAKLFGATDDAPYLWRAADAIVARPRLRTAARALAINARMVAFSPDDGAGEALGQALADRKMGALAKSALLVASSLEPLLAMPHRPSARTGTDGAGNVADVVSVVAREVGAVVAESERPHAAAAGGAAAGPAAAEEPRSAAGDLEDLSSGGGLEDLFGGAAKPEGAAGRKLGELDARMQELARMVTAAQEALEKADRDKARAEATGDAEAARAAGRGAEGARRRMHKALGEMADVERQIRRLRGGGDKRRGNPSGARARSGGGGTSTHRRGPSLDDMLDDMKRKQSASVDDELEALKRRMTKKGKR